MPKSKYDITNNNFGLKKVVSHIVIVVTDDKTLLYGQSS